MPDPAATAELKAWIRKARWRLAWLTTPLVVWSMLVARGYGPAKVRYDAHQVWAASQPAPPSLPEGLRQRLELQSPDDCDPAALRSAADQVDWTDPAQYQGEGACARWLSAAQSPLDAADELLGLPDAWWAGGERYGSDLDLPWTTVYLDFGKALAARAQAHAIAGDASATMADLDRLLRLMDRMRSGRGAVTFLCLSAVSWTALETAGRILVLGPDDRSLYQQLAATIELATCRAADDLARACRQEAALIGVSFDAMAVGDLRALRNRAGMSHLPYDRIPPLFNPVVVLAPEDRDLLTSLMAGMEHADLSQRFDERDLKAGRLGLLAKMLTPITIIVDAAQRTAAAGRLFQAALRMKEDQVSPDPPLPVDLHDTRIRRLEDGRLELHWPGHDHQLQELPDKFLVLVRAGDDVAIRLPPVGWRRQRDVHKTHAAEGVVP